MKNDAEKQLTQEQTAEMFAHFRQIITAAQRGKPPPPAPKWAAEALRADHLALRRVITPRIAATAASFRTDRDDRAGEKDDLDLER
ncbi:MAG: hypothetical protein GJU72_07525 [Acidithiobacillus ferriphilus]|jgi:hypothetical protein|uniref:hypothetical protein n=1 Tax=Acidithiobacillus ferriphilus TaxID=1689834 RepID=UPI00242DBDD0|nr:hypothetical protein [Acidithiobacillus ferriphilus]MBW9248907.1 hypothetical protein [Acidithiobacillus ferriphilus]MBW9254872.1 hypothetical protein [Acidithiobacillus ferriphilus]